MKYIEKSTISFLKELSQNNERKWFDLHRDEYKKARENFVDFFYKVAYELSLADSYLIEESEYLEKIREKIIDDPKSFKKIINNPEVRRIYTPLSEA